MICYCQQSPSQVKTDGTECAAVRIVRLLPDKVRGRVPQLAVMLRSASQSIVLRLLAERLKGLPDITVGAINHPQSN